VIGPEPFGDLALRFATPARAAARRALFGHLHAASVIVDAVLAEHEGIVTFAETDARASAAVELGAALERAGDADASALAKAPATHTIAVVYDGEDLDEVGRRSGLGRAGVARAHAAATYEVAMLGFLPGFAYLRATSGADGALALPRRASPRPRVPAGALAIAAEYTGIYPCASPGGWHLLGRAVGFRAFTSASGARLALGDRVVLTPVLAADEVLGDATETPAPMPIASRGALDVTRAIGPSLVVDLGRPGRMHEGIPPGGPLVPEAFVLANLVLGNVAGAAGLEVHGVLELRARTAVRFADGDGVVRALAAGESCTISHGGKARATYLAVEGGLDMPSVLGGAGTLLVAGLGGLDGRVLRRGDTLAIAHARTAGARAGPPRWCRPAPASERALAPVDLLPGPDGDDETLAALARGRYRVAFASDRSGTRLDGDAPPARDDRARRASTPMVQGAIERTPAGLVVLGPDHPTTGGYPVVAVVSAASRGALFARPLGAEVTFRIAAR
jgi:KipI family sensor histidine kinase inhibitor